MLFPLASSVFTRSFCFHPSKFLLRSSDVCSCHFALCYLRIDGVIEYNVSVSGYEEQLLPEPSLLNLILALTISLTNMCNKATKQRKCSRSLPGIAFLLSPSCVRVCRNVLYCSQWPKVTGRATYYNIVLSGHLMLLPLCPQLSGLLRSKN